MLIREITPEDAKGYLNLRIRSEQEFPQFVGFNAERELAAGASGIVALLAGYASEGTLAWGSFNGPELLGVLVLSRRASPKYRHKVFLWGMYVVEASRGLGIAPALLQTAIAWAKERPEILAISLQVTLSNARGLSFYQRHGFKIFGTEPRALWAAGHYHGVHYLELELKDA